MEYDPEHVSNEIAETRRSLNEITDQLEEVCKLRGFTLNRDVFKLEYNEEHDECEDDSENSEEFDRLVDSIESKILELSTKVDALELYMYPEEMEDTIEATVNEYQWKFD